MFTLVAEREARPYLGDTWCFATMDRLVRGPQPLLIAEPAPAPVDSNTWLRLTDAGARVLAGQADYVRINGIDRWIGGVHLSGRDVAWRFDEGTEQVRAAGQSESCQSSAG